MTLSATLPRGGVIRCRSAGTALGRLALPVCGSAGGDVVGGQGGLGGLWDRGDVREDRDDRGGPGPRVRDPQSASAGAVGESSRDMQEAVAKRFRLARGERLGV